MFSEIFLIAVVVGGLSFFTIAREDTATHAQPPAVACALNEAPEAALTIGAAPFTRADVAAVRLIDDYGRRAVEITFTPTGAQTIAELTSAAVGQELPISLNGRMVASPVVQEAILGGEVRLTGFTQDEAALLAAAFAPACQ